MDIRPIQSTEIEDARVLLASSGWSHRVSDAEQFQELLARSQIALVAVDQGKVVGFVRGLTDGVTNGYISMLVVDESHRLRGIGSALVRAAMGQNPEMTWVLRAQRPGLFSFYEKLGFRVSSVAMERVRASAS
ncbi:GNAT family N-acetyltransferase [Caenimonas koreensis]|uniref:GNAT family N-acetyltransferase n=1 Tax=Caenimonas koreensis DSM 17982 TaxID=1121255 RepID=A0A844B9R3_9BURK|nr:GNAT family N-acetyltransferase [Caenimonas koreensis]MRD48256.1 GNAT family N-acetyltransferase [Caenimonas koreensis DSM 17982]